MGPRKWRHPLLATCPLVLVLVCEKSVVTWLPDLSPAPTAYFARAVWHSDAGHLPLWLPHRRGPWRRHLLCPDSHSETGRRAERRNNRRQKSRGLPTLTEIARGNEI